MKDRSTFKSPLKIKTNKRDIAPIGIIFDVYNIGTFSLPVSPIPMRIDKIFNAQPTLFIKPDIAMLKKHINNYKYDIDWEQFYSYGIQNLINYAKKKIWEISHQELKRDVILKWISKSISVNSNIISLKEDFTKIYIEFIKTYDQISIKRLNYEDQSYRDELIDYCEKVIKYFVEKLENNTIKIIYKNSEQEQSIFNEKRGKIYPSLILTEVQKKDRKKATSKMCFVPYLIYDDIIDTFTYNKKLLIEGDLHYINTSDLERKGIIIKGSKIDYINSVDMFEKIFEHILTYLEKKL